MNAKSYEGSRFEPKVVSVTSLAQGEFTRFKALTEDQYSEFCEKLPHAELYQCRGCTFVHRFPSKVRRHFHYRHSVVAPYRCGHCTYRAVERGKVVNHCRSAHPSRKVAVLARDDEAVQGGSNLHGDGKKIPRPVVERQTYNLSSLRNITKSTIVSQSKLQMNSERAKNVESSKLQKNSERTENVEETAYADRTKTVNMRSSSTPSSGRLSSKGMINDNVNGDDDDDDDNLDESDNMDDKESSDEYVPPSSKKKKSHASSHAPPRSETVYDRSAAVAAQICDSESGTGNDNDNRNENIDEDQEDEEDEMALSEAGDDPTCDHIPCETLFAINRTTYRPPWQSQAPSDREDSNAHKSDSNLPTTVQIKTEPVDDYETQSNQSATVTAKAPTVQAPRPRPSSSLSELRRELPGRAPVLTGGTTNQRQYYCVYCGLTSRWNRRDVRLHVMHVHVGVRAFSCGHCGFGNSKNRAIVRSHCAKSHPGRRMLIVDNEPVFEAIDSVQEKDNVVAVAFTTTDGSALLTLDELDEYLATKGIQTPTAGRKTSEPKAPQFPQTDPKHVHEAVRSAVCNQSQQQDKPDERQQPEISRESLNSSELTVNKDQTENVNNCQWKCRLCEFKDSGFAQVESHIVRQHPQLETYKCPHCDEYFSESQAQPNGCPHCQEYFSESQEVLLHIDFDHAGCERQILSTVDEKSAYIRRNIQCISAVEVESSSVNRQNKFQTDRASSVQTRSDDSRNGQSNAKNLELEKDTTAIPHNFTDVKRSNNAQSQLRALLLQAEPLQTGEVSPTVKNSMTEEKDRSNSTLSSSQEEHRDSDNGPPILSCSSEKLQNEVRNNDEGAKSVADAPELHQVIGANLGSNEPTRNEDILKTSHIDHFINDDLPTSVEDQLLPGDFLHREEHTSALNNLPTSSTTSEITTNEENGENWRAIHEEHVNADTLPVSADKQNLFKGLPRSDEHIQQSSSAPVLSIITSNDSSNDEGNKDTPPILVEEQLSPENLSSADDHGQQLNDVSMPVTDQCLTTDEGNNDYRPTSHAEHNTADLPTSREEQGSFKDSSDSTENTQQPIDTLVPSTPSDTRNVDVWKNSQVEEIAEKVVPVLPEQESATTPLEEHTKQLSNSVHLPATEMEMGNVQEQRKDSHVENPHPRSKDVLGSDLSTGIVQPLVDASVLQQDQLPDDQTTANPRERIENNFQSLSDVVTRPSNMSTEQKLSNDSTKNFGNKPFSDATTLSEDYRQSGNPAKDNRSSSTGRAPQSGRLSDDEEGLSSDSSSMDDTSTWRCDDCSFVATSESLLVAHRRSRQQYRCLYCPDFVHSSVVHLRHHCLTRHPGKPISYKHTEIPCSEIKSTTLSNDSSRSPASSCQSVNTGIAKQPKNAEAPCRNTVTVANPGNPEPENPGADKSDESYSMELDESSVTEESDNSEDSDEYEPAPKKKSKLGKKNVSKTRKDADASAAGPQAIDHVCDLCNSYNTSNSTVIRHHVMSHLQYYPYFCPHCDDFRAVRSFPVIKHIRQKHRGKAERFECNADPEMEKKVRNSYHRLNAKKKDDQAKKKDYRCRDEENQDLQPLQPVVQATKVTRNSKSEAREKQVAPAPGVGNKNRKILYRCKFCGLKTHLRGDFRHHIMRELQYKPHK